MKKIENLEDLFIEESWELYNSNKEQLQALPRFEQQSNSLALKKLINKEIQHTEKQQSWLKELLVESKVKADEGKCETTKAILREFEHKLERSKGESVRDAGIVSSLQQLGHRKIAGLGATSAYAREIGHKDRAEQLRNWLQEEKDLGRDLIQLARTDINHKASLAQDSEDYRQPLNPIRSSKN
jgi:ferritin-like metal-binding protein YciE